MKKSDLMTGSSLINAFKALKNKPMVLLLLFPIYAVAPFALLLLPLYDEKKMDNSAAPIIMLIILAAFLVFIIGALVRAVLLIPPAMELLHDGAAGVATPKGWYVRGLKKHWWKRISLGAVEKTVSYIVSFVFQIITSIGVPLLVLLENPSNAAGAAPSAAAIIIFAALYIFSYLALIAFMFLLQSLSAYILAALADRNFSMAFKAVFSKLGFRRFLKLLGGRLLIGAASSVIIAALVIGVLMLSAIFPTTNVANSYTVLVPMAFIVSFCLFIFSYIEVYRFAFDFCVFQDFKNAEAMAPALKKPEISDVQEEGAHE